ncbi:PAT1 multi-domain protein [Pyrenophora tritici-repentis]|nr:PAT1 multi-domain protein [Pyrenophora tritici-repentis]KAI0624281.1 PAT1 multi-domain protein [Pyrenophora tritici-repentis]KAI2478800.1 PAT1 multi-domain protein [Pyrenophora tritici-repentis]
MPPQQGEVSLLTLFADVHYYISPPSQHPPHHRFDKSSYVYLYHNPMRQSGRIEIANHAGTPNQDAFAGQLDTVKIEQTYKHPCLFTLTVDAFQSQNGSQPPHQDMSQWHLPTPDPSGQGKYMYRLHTVDLYFWTPEDASLFLDSIRRVLQPHQLQIVRNPDTALAHSEHKNDALSPVIARLENAAISHTSRSTSISTTQSFPGPPSAPAPTSPPPNEQPPNYAPMAYNPAAPAAPEPIAHREKTPPPPDANDGTGLGSAAVHDQHAAQYGNPLQTSFAPQPTSGAYFPGPPAPGQGFTGPPSAYRTNTTGSVPSATQTPPSFAPPPSAPPPGQYNGQTPPPPSLQRSSTVPVQQYANYPNSPGFPPAPQSPPAHSALPSPGFPPQQYQPMPSPAFSQFAYGSTAEQGQAPNIHQQLYRPTESEAAVHHHENPNAQPRNSNIGKRVDKVEKGIGSFLKKLDKKF